MKIPLFDAHCDTSWTMIRQGERLRENSGHVDLKRAGRYAPYAQFFAIFQLRGTYQDYLLQRGHLAKEFSENRDLISLCTSAAEAEAAFSQGKSAAFLSVEGAELLDCSEALLAKARADGVRLVNLTWNYENALAGSNAQGKNHGLTDRGRSFVKKCGELGIYVDVSHISEPAFWDVAACSALPIVASHSNSAAVCPHPRNLTDEQFRAIVRSGGVAGINLYAPFVGENPEVGDVIEHILHFCSLGGEKHIAIGADLDGCDTLPRGINGIQDMEKLYEQLLKRNVKESTVQDIFFHNLMRLF